MKRLAISLSVCLALVGVAATGHARRGGGGGKAAAPAADENAGGEGGGDKAAAAGGGDNSAPASESLDTTEQEPAKIDESLSEPKKQGPTTTLSWQDIVVVPRKAFLKGGRVELQPLAGVTVNDNLIRHFVFGADINYFLTDALWVGLQGQYFVKQLETQTELLGLQFNRTSTMNRYLYGGAFNMGYVPGYGKFALFNRQIIHWEVWISAGFGATFTEVIARNPADQASKAFKNTALTPNAGLGGRLFLTDWMTVNIALRDYIIADKYEPLAPCMNADDCKAHADSALVNNVMVYAGVGFYLPTKFTYKTPR
jgi:outer membrane beta-barrel protein